MCVKTFRIYSIFLTLSHPSVLRARFVTLCISIFLLLSACTSKQIYHDDNFNPPVYFGTHVVRPGENLYRIAWRYGRDFQELAQANKIPSPYVIQPGQKINLELRAPASSSVSSSTKSRQSRKRNVTERKDTQSFRNKVTKNKNSKKLNNIKWGWPHSGPILAKYAFGNTANAPRKVNKGIDIGGRSGDPIRATASGEVVYAGNGLLGYGNLVIINHNERFLSAYAHNRKILVKEGQQISQGQVIAEMGRSGADQTKLHFEIRVDGQPVNPQKYLPPRP